MPIVITGASGQLGRGVADRLLDRVDPADLILVTRSPDALAAYADRGADVRAGDFDDPAGLLGAFAGGERLLLISTAVPGPGRVRQHRDAVAAAAAAGVRHVVYTSILRPEEDNPAGVVPDHRATEAAIEGSGLARTFLRSSIYGDLEAFSIPAAAASGTLFSNGGEGRVSYVAREDLAAAAAAVLTGDGHDRRAYDITGPEALTAADRAVVYTEVAGAPVQPALVDDAAYTEGLVSGAGLPRPAAELYASFGRAARGGWFEHVSDDVEALTGRAPRTLRDLLGASRASAAQSA
jgi:NAD(P)H dehydrogenase (quinone)